MSEMTQSFDVVVIGGGAAGLSGALMLGRARRSVLVIDGGDPRNAPAAGVHGFLGHDGLAPAALLEAGRAEVRGYGVEVVDGRVSAAAPVDGGFAVDLEDGRRFGARRLLVATGLADELPDVDGLRERWGRDVLHCPYCHGWEVRDEPLGVLGTGQWSFHQVLLLRQWSADLTLFLHTAPAPTDEQAEQLRARGIAVVAGEVAAIETVDDRISGVRMRSGELVPRKALAVLTRLVARTAPLAGLGLRAVPDAHGIGERIEADATGRTTVPGVWVAGNVGDLMAQVVGAADQGARAGAMINADLVEEDTRDAVAAYRGTPVGAARE